MANDQAPTSSPRSVLPPGNLGKFVLRPLEVGFAAMEREALKMGVPSHDVVGMILNHLCSIVAMIEPAGARARMIEDIQRDLPDLIRKHVEARFMTPGGIMVPNDQAWSAKNGG